MKNDILKKYSVVSLIGVVFLIMINLFFRNEDIMSPYLTRGYLGGSIRVLFVAIFLLCLYLTTKVIIFYINNRRKIDVYLLFVFPFVIYFIRLIVLIFLSFLRG